MSVSLRRFTNLDRPVDLSPSRSAREAALPAFAEVLNAGSWGNWDVLDPRGQVVTINVFEVIDSDLQIVGQAFADGVFTESDVDGGGVEYTTDDVEVLEAIERLADFDLLAASGILTAR